MAKQNSLSLAGVYKPKAKIEESSLPVALVQYLADYTHIRKVVLRLDNNFCGTDCRKHYQDPAFKEIRGHGGYSAAPARARTTTTVYVCGLDLPITKRKERSKEQ